MFPLLYFVITFVSIKQILTGTTPLNQTFQNSFPILYFYSQNDGKVEAKRLLGTLLRILVMNISKQEMLVTIKENLHFCSDPRIHIPYIVLCNIQII